MKILTYTSLFPNSVQPNHGIFIQNRLLHFVRTCGHQWHVVAPVPYFPNWPIFGRWHEFSRVPREDVLAGFPVLYPRYLVTPRVGMMLYGWHMLSGTRKTVKRVQRVFNFDLIDAHFLYPDGFAAVCLGALLKKPVIVSARGSDVHLYSRFLSIRPLLKFVLQRADAIISVSHSLKEQIIRLGIAEDKVAVIENGVDLAEFFPEDKLTARQRLGLPREKTILLSVARLDPVKGIHYLIEALAQLVSEDRDVSLVIVGPPSDPAYASSVQQLVATKGLGGRVRFAGAQPHSQLRDWYNACDLFCLSSVREGWPNVLLEAMACGKPIVASRVGGVPECLSSPNLGVLVDTPGGTTFASAIRAALTRQWDRSAAVRHSATHDWGTVSQRQELLFTQVLAAPPASAELAQAPPLNPK
ncbi:MAG: glycosyltransferase family 4 protein [Acidobacteria bacterium]|nr:glycosyltransferase family 4 protein [Acidobacteriota bacterium]